ncbi:MAG: tRNA (adenosine(37)-N6)-threonylcarbamoyltransferase complex transferase subunit TsaD [Paludibacteraceae bacterium]|nr:tRNA (adenosine(37)-N6)-threonylcarbamoyltransferase complex transferase subunit TsaD [Paludibacteraceae bacterium]
MKETIILAIESSCDDTSAAVIRDGILLSNVTASQGVHEEFGGVVPELASRAHQLNIVPVVDAALKRAGVTADQLSAIAFTRGPGLLGSLLVGTSFAKGLALSQNIPLVEVNHLQAHILAHFIEEKSENRESGIGKRGAGNESRESGGGNPSFPFLCLLVSGGNSQIVLVKDHYTMEIIGQTIDDAAGEAFDKCAKIMGLPYPGGPWIDRLAKEGNAEAYQFSKPHIPEYNYYFSGLKTSFLYFLRDNLKENPDFIEENKADLCASLQKTIIDILINKLKKAAKDLGVKEIAVAGGVSANSGLRNALIDLGKRHRWKVHIPPFAYTTDNAAMVAQAGYYKYLKGEFCPVDAAPYAKTRI